MNFKEVLKFQLVQLSFITVISVEKQPLVVVKLPRIAGELAGARVMESMMELKRIMQWKRIREIRTTTSGSQCWR